MSGTFPQRVEIGIVKDAQTNVMETDGYLLFDQRIATDHAANPLGHLHPTLS